uniref:Periplasmic protein-like protein n=1 Tax=Solibacter usitatus (strain Ellin6076) TaxID=234267 RepID=Q01X78_SOLUE
MSNTMIMTRFAWAFIYAANALAGDIVIHLDDAAIPSRQVIRYQCDSNAPKLGLPDGPFQVEYINAGGNSLAVLPISGKPVIFANVLSGSGARYAAQQYIWWEAAGRSVSLTSDTLAGKVESICRRVNAK